MRRMDIGLLLIAVLAAWTFPAVADVAVNWQNNNPVVVEDPPATRTNTGDRDTYAQLLWTTNSSSAWTPDVGEVSASDTNGTIYGGNTYLLDSYIVPAVNEGAFDAGIGVYSNGNVGGNNINAAGSVIYSILYSDTNIYDFLATWFYVSHFTNTVVYNSLDINTIMTMDVTRDGPIGGDSYAAYEYQLVPEPVSLSLYGLGIVAVWAGTRRRRASR